MFDFFRKKAARQKHEAELKEKLAQSLTKYNPDEDEMISQFTDIDFGEGIERVKKEQITLTDRSNTLTDRSNTLKNNKLN